MIRRRQLLKTAAALSAWSLTSAHTPYRQWAIDRKKHLQIGANKADPPTYELGKRIVTLLDGELPESRARVARAPHALRLASLMTTRQIELVLLSGEDLAALRDGKSGFMAFGKTELRCLFRFGTYWLVSCPDFPEDHAHLLTETFMSHGMGIAKIQGRPGDDSPVPAHPGVSRS